MQHRSPRRGGERVDEPRPRHIRQQRVHPDVGFEGRLGEADDAPRTSPLRWFGGVVEEDEPAGAVFRIGARGVRTNVGGEGEGERCEAGRRGNLTHRQIVAELRLLDQRNGTLEGGGCRRRRMLSHADRLE